MTPLSVPAESPSDSKERKDLKPGDSNFQVTRRTSLEVVQIIHESETYVSRHGQRTLPDSMTPDCCNHLVDNLILVAHMVSINDSISLDNALLTLGMSDVYQSRIIQSILCTRTSINPEVPDGNLALWELWTKGLSSNSYIRVLVPLNSLSGILSLYSHTYTHFCVLVLSRYE